MRAGRLRWSVLAIGMLPLAGCPRNESAAVEITPVPPLQPFVFYDKTGDPSKHNPPLSERALQETIAWVGTQTSDPVWLIRVTSFAEGTWLSTIAHLVPDEITPRIRIGRAYDIPTSHRQTDICAPWIYAQVSMAGQDFGEQLTKPSIREMPFGFPSVVDPDFKNSSSMSNEEVVAITAFVRQPSSYERIAPRGGLSNEEVFQRILKSSICHMWRIGDEITVSFGYARDSMWGDWFLVTLERTPTGYKVVSWGEVIA
jgi:hypothetical protein